MQEFQHPLVHLRNEGAQIKNEMASNEEFLLSTDIDSYRTQQKKLENEMEEKMIHLET
jgi:hypothetical protein